MPLFLTILFIFLLAPVMQLLQHLMKLARNRKSKVCSILHKSQAFIGDIEENDRRPQHAAGSYHLCIQKMPYTNQGKDQNLPALCEIYIYANKLGLNLLIFLDLQ